MSFDFLSQSQQVVGGFNNGAIVENKPIGFPQESGGFRAYSNILYWAHARSETGSTIGEHPHQAFEILTFVLKGSIEHYDSATKKWTPLAAGGVQVMRAGSGISHAERMHAGSHIFQIWFDPGVSQSVKKPASYENFPSEHFREASGPLGRTVTYIGDDGPIGLDTSPLLVQRISTAPGPHRMDLGVESIVSVYVIGGRISAENHTVQTDDFVRLRDETAFSFVAESPSDLFIIKSPKKPGYQTYAPMQGLDE